MPKRAMSFKPTSEVEEVLAALMESWSCDRTAVVNRAILSAGRHQAARDIDDPETAPSKARTKAIEVGDTLDKIPSPHPISKSAFKELAVPKSEGRMVTLTREQREARTLEFQRKMGKK